MPEKELFNQTLKSEIALTDRIAVGVPSLLGADNILFSSFIRQTGISLIKRYPTLTDGQVFAMPSNSKLIGIDFKNQGTSIIKVSNLLDGDLISEIEFSGSLINQFDQYFNDASNITINFSGSSTICVIRYIYNWF